MPNMCEICGKDCKTAQGLAAHKRFQHPIIDDNLIQEDTSGYTREEIDNDFRIVVNSIAKLTDICVKYEDLFDRQSNLIKILCDCIRELKSNDLTLNWRMTKLERSIEQKLPLHQRHYMQQEP